MVAEIPFSILRQISFWGILVGIITFAWLLYAMIRYRASIVPDTTDVDHIVVGSFPVDRHNTKIGIILRCANYHCRLVSCPCACIKHWYG